MAIVDVIEGVATEDEMSHILVGIREDDQSKELSVRGKVVERPMGIPTSGIVDAVCRWIELPHGRGQVE